MSGGQRKQQAGTRTNWTTPGVSVTEPRPALFPATAAGPRRGPSPPRISSGVDPGLRLTVTHPRVFLRPRGQQGCGSALRTVTGH